MKFSNKLFIFLISWIIFAIAIALIFKKDKTTKIGSKEVIETGIDENQKKYESLKTQSNQIGTWIITNTKLNVNYKYEIYENSNSYYGVYAQEDDFDFKTEKLLKDNNNYFVIGSDYGEYYRVDLNNELELFDNEGSLKDAGYFAYKFR